MERTANNIADKMEANTNGFRERPDQAGRPRGRKNNATIIVAKTDPSKDELISMARDLGRAVFIVEDKEDKQMMEKMKNF
jgi:hypothetical protein